MAPRCRRRPWLLAASVVCLGVVLVGCGDLEGIGEQAARDAIEKAEEALKEAERAARDAQQDSGARSEAMKAARKWPSRPPDPPGVRPSARSGTTYDDFAVEDAFYPDSEYDEVIEHYTEHFGEPPAKYGAYDAVWEKVGGPGEISTTVTRGERGTFTVTNVWHRP